MDAKGEKGWSEGRWGKGTDCNFICIETDFPYIAWNFRFSGDCFLVLCLQADRIK